MEWLITVRVNAPDTFNDREPDDPDTVLALVQSEIVSNLEECGAEAVIVRVAEDGPGGCE